MKEHGPMWIKLRWSFLNQTILLLILGQYLVSSSSTSSSKSFAVNKSVSVNQSALPVYPNQQQLASSGILNVPESSLVTLFDNVDYHLVIVRYVIEDLIDCMNLLQNALHRVSSVATHWNCVRLYDQRDCQGEMLELSGPAGNRGDNLIKYGFNDMASSIIDCDSVVQLHSEVTKFKLLTNLTLLLEDGALDRVEMASKSDFTNNGSTPILKTYMEEKVYKETYVYEKMESLSVMTSLELSASMSMESQTGIPFIEQETLKVELRAAFQFQTKEEYRKREEHKTEKSRKFQVKDKFTVPPCSKYEVSSYLTVKEDIPVEFEMEMQVSGRLPNGGQLTTEQLRKRLDPKMEYLREVTNYRIQVRTKGNIVSSLGVKSEVEANQSRIPGCGGQNGFFGKYVGYFIGGGVVAACGLMTVAAAVVAVRYRRRRDYSNIN